MGIKQLDMPFRVELPVSMFEKADAPEGKRRRIGGIISTDKTDLQKETVNQSGLDFDPFLANGWFNDNHSKTTTGVLGYPEYVKRFAKGQKLPDGETAKRNCNWSEGYLLDNWEPADKIWKLGQSLKGTGRKLGFSLEGSVRQRENYDGKKVVKAVVRNVAVTNCPINDDSELQCLEKSLTAIENMPANQIDALVKASDFDDRIKNIETMLEKALTVGTPANPPTSPTGEGPFTGAGAGQVLGRESLESDLKDKKKKKKDILEEEYEKSLSSVDVDSLIWIKERIPSISLSSAEQFIKLTKTLKRQGKL